jgi:uncharacterized membrane protein HdeD (DUF308 family)
MTTAPADSPIRTATTDATPVLRKLYFGRFAFAIVWAAAFGLTASPYGSAALALAVLYPVFDVVAAAIDARSAAAAGRSRVALYLNIGVSAVAAVALGVVGTGDVGDVLRVWGAWAIASGAVQLAVGVQRRAQKGHYPMIFSGGISILAGSSFVISAHDATKLTSIAGYAVLGGVFFLVSALRLGRRDQTADAPA